MDRMRDRQRSLDDEDHPFVFRWDLDHSLTAVVCCSIVDDLESSRIVPFGYKGRTTDEPLEYGTAFAYGDTLIARDISC